MGNNWDQFGQDYDHDLFYGKPRTYLIASTPRSGSHFLGHLLLGTGVLGSPLEYFHPGHAKKWMAILGTDDFRTMLTGLYQRRTSPSGWFGVKAHWAQFAPIARSGAHFRFLDFSKYIEIRRRDRVAQAISLVIAQQTQQWISFHNPSQQPRYDFSSIHAAALALDQHIGKWHNFFRNRGISPIVVEYEDLMSHTQDVLDTILLDFDVDRSDIPRQKWLPKRQASDLNMRWQDQYLNDLSMLPAQASNP